MTAGPAEQSYGESAEGCKQERRRTYVPSEELCLPECLKENRVAPAPTQLLHHQGTRDELSLQQTRGSSSSSWFSGGFLDHLDMG